MTTQVPNLQDTVELVEREPARISRSWLFLGALAVVTGLGYTAGALLGPKGAPAPSPGDGRPAVAATDTGPKAKPQPQPPTAAAAVVTEKDADEEDGFEPAPTAAADGAFYVQVASYKGEKDAAEYAETLAARGLSSARSSPSADPSTGSWHLVQLGPYKTRGEAEKARFQLKLQEREKAYVTPRSNGKYHVQVGSFATMEEAQPIAKRLDDQGHVTKVSRIKMGDKRWYCVRIGPFDTADEAFDYQELVKGIPGAQPTVIPFGPPKN